MRQLILLLALSLAAWSQAKPVIRFFTYAGAPTSADCDASDEVGRVAFNTNTSPDTIYDCAETSSTVQWISRTAGAGTVTSVALTAASIFSVTGSPVTTSGTLDLALASQTANKVFASPNGSTGTPTFRALVAADIPDLSGTYQSLDADLTAIAGISASRGALIRKGATAWEGVALGGNGALLASDGTDAVWLARVSASSTIDFGNLNDGACQESTFTLTGAVVGDPVALGVGTALPSGVSATARVTAADTAEVQECNFSGNAVDLSSRSFTIRVVR